MFVDVNCFFFIVLFVETHSSSIKIPTIAILSQSNLYFGQIKEFNSTNDRLHIYYHHEDPIYQLQSLISDENNQELYFCSTNIVYKFDPSSSTFPIALIPIDTTPCRSGLTYVADERILLWIHTRSLIQLDLLQMKKSYRWNSTSKLIQLIYNQTIDESQIFYLSISDNDDQSSIFRCQSDRFEGDDPFKNCFFLDTHYGEVSTMAISKNFLYVADRIQQRFFVLTVSDNGYVEDKHQLPLNSSVVADVQSMFIYENHLIWLTISGHVRIVSLSNFQYRTLFWIDETLKGIQMITMNQWSNETTSTVTPPETNRTSTRNSPSTSEPKERTTMQNSSDSWKITTYITSILLGVVFFVCAALITCMRLNYRSAHIVPHSFTNVLHIFRRRVTASDRSLTISMEQT